VIVVGAGIAGLSAALEASAAGAEVLVLDMNSVGGGHAVMAGGLSLVGTPLQARRGVADSPELALADIVAWGEDPDVEWARRYVESSRREVHDWLTRFGVAFTLLLPAPGETSVPRFHFAGGTAANVVVPMLAEALTRPGLRLRRNAEVVALDRAGPLHTVTIRDTRSGERARLAAPALVLATGGFENDLTRVRDHWRDEIPRPDRLLAGAGHHARGAGLDLARAAGAALTQLDRQTIFVTGFPNPRDPRGVDGLLASNPAAVFVDRSGRRFIDENASRKALEQTVLRLPGQAWWMIFDASGAGRLQVRGAPWLTPARLDAEILGNPAVVERAATPAALGRATGLPPAALHATITRFNAMVADGVDADFGRFGAGTATPVPRPLATPPFHALRLYPMTRKSMGGVAIDARCRALDAAGQPVDGLFAAGELTGVAGINGLHGGSGTFLGPAVLTGRIAGRAAARHATASPAGYRGTPDTGDAPSSVSAARAPSSLMPARTASAPLRRKSRDGVMKSSLWMATGTPAASSVAA